MTLQSITASSSHSHNSDEILSDTSSVTRGLTLIEILIGISKFAFLLAITISATACHEPPTDSSIPDAQPDVADLGLDEAVDVGIVEPCDAPLDQTEQWTLGEWTIVVTPATGEWQVRTGDQLRLRSVSGCGSDGYRPALRIGEGTPLVNNLFGAFEVDLTSLEWVQPTASPTVQSNDAEVRIQWPLGAIVFEPHPHGLLVHLDSPTPAGELVIACGPDEAFFGLGSQVTGFDLRGRTYPLWTQEQGIGKPEDGGRFPLQNRPEAAYAPMGVWHSSANYSAIVTHDAYQEIDLCQTASDALRLRSFSAQPGLLLLEGANIRERMATLRNLVGPHAPVPDWVFGPWNDAVGGPDRLAAVAEFLRTQDIASSAIWSEDWIGGSETVTGFRLSYAWEWDEALYPSLPEDIENLHRNGFAFLGYFNPFVPQTTRMWSEGFAEGYLVMQADGNVLQFLDPAFREAGLIDLTNPEARRWLFEYQHRAAADIGIDGWMADFAEWLPVDALMHDGTPGWQAHNRYPLEWQRANVEALEAARPDGNWTFFVRSGWASLAGATTGIAPTMWGGDQNTDWGRDDGLPSVLPIALHLGLAGVSIFGSDIAGYSSFTTPNTDKELFYRWASFGALQPLMRTHHGSDECANWSFDRDGETTAHYRRWAAIHTLLFPYFQVLLNEARTPGLPMMRHPYLVAPSSPAYWRRATDSFFLGDDLLVTPVIEQGSTGREAILPEAGWWPLFGDTPLSEGPGDDGIVSIQLEVPITEVPIFVRPGTILPLLPRVVNSFFGATADGVSDLSDVAGFRRLALYPAADGSLRETNLGDTVIRGGGWTSPVDWAQSEVEGVSREPCADANATACRLAEGIRLDGPTTLRVGERWLELAEGRWEVLWAGAAWGQWRDPTPVTDLNPDIPPPCESPH